ncbi:MAG: glyoxylate/hydroxypyruvate reductase A [Rhizobiaceae bacterium]
MSGKGILLDTKFDISNRVEQFQDVFSGHDIINWQENKPAGPTLTNVKYAIVWKPTLGLMKGLPNLEVIFSWGAGVDHVFADPNLPDIPIVRFVDADLTGRMVEYVVLQVLMHMRQQRRYDQQQRRQQWVELVDPTASQMRIGIMGFGELGQASARALLALGFQINSWSRSPKDMEKVTSFYGDDGLEPFLNQSDILVALLPHTKETHGILNSDLIAKLASDGPFGAPILINAGRGGSQVETDLIEALNSGALRGVSLDVFETEPLPKESQFWELDNAIITPHSAAVSSATAVAHHVKKQIDRYEQGLALQHVVDPSQGY